MRADLTRFSHFPSTSAANRSDHGSNAPFRDGGRRGTFILVVLAAIAVLFAMLQLITILNRCHHFRGFVYQHACFGSDYGSIEIAVRPRQGFGGGLFPLPPAGTRLRSTRREEGKLLSVASTAHILQTMRECATFPDRLKGGAAPGWQVAHKTGTSGSWKRLTAATNDVGILTAPDRDLRLPTKTSVSHP